MVTRRRVLKTIGGGVLLSSSALTWAVGIEPHWYEVVHTRLRLAGLSASLVGKRLVQLSDLHIGVVGLDYLIGACQTINDLKPDLLVITGDFINHDYVGDTRDVAHVLGTLKPATIGTFGCIGNHDFGYGWKNVRTADRVTATATAAGVRMLRDEVINIDGLTIVGLEDLWSPNFSASCVLARVDDRRGALCLCHNPDACDEPVWGGFRGQILSGHTHGGQCKPPFLPAPFLPVVNRSYIAGHYEIASGRSLYINRGIGYTHRARFNCRPEITAFTLERDDAA